MAIAYAGGTRDFGAVQEFQQRTCELQVTYVIFCHVNMARKSVGLFTGV